MLKEKNLNTKIFFKTTLSDLYTSIENEIDIEERMKD